MMLQGIQVPVQHLIGILIYVEDDAAEVYRESLFHDWRYLFGL
jgi:hypothetical protein